MSEELTNGLSSEEKLNQLLAMALETRKELHDLKASHKELADTVERRLKDTRPIWEAVLTRIEAIETRYENLAVEVKQELALGLRRIEKTLEVIHKDHQVLRLDNVLLEERVEKLESKEP